MEKFGWIGFDVDHTLVQYALEEMERLEVHVLIGYFRKRAKFDPSIDMAFLDSLTIEQRFFVRGVTLDLEKGNILKHDSCNHVISGTHGMRTLSREEIAECYEGPSNALADWVPGVTHPRFRTPHSFFERAVTAVFAGLVEMCDHRGPLAPVQQPPQPAAPSCATYAGAYQAMTAGYGETFSQWGKGDFFPAFAADPARHHLLGIEDAPDYVRGGPGAGAVLEWLRALRQRHGVRLFVCSNSVPQYVTLALDTAYGPGWRDVFDLVVANARKPHFWRPCAPQAQQDGPPFAQFMAAGPGGALRMAYVGDSLPHDVGVPHGEVGLAGVALVEELQLYEDPLALRRRWGLAPVPAEVAVGPLETAAPSESGWGSAPAHGTPLAASPAPPAPAAAPLFLEPIDPTLVPLEPFGDFLTAAPPSALRAGPFPRLAAPRTGGGEASSGQGPAPTAWAEYIRRHAVLTAPSLARLAGCYLARATALPQSQSPSPSQARTRPQGSASLGFAAPGAPGLPPPSMPPRPSPPEAEAEAEAEVAAKEEARWPVGIPLARIFA
ncbi:hypothetical protein PAPYR_6480 [Paratrimastix pyriformis]|uniref:5'-nucleotidase n=1 Tax=Paratrimastix pyriformis TaxID=342808 RepID=A0ABQ8UFC8_9EUKA|nr:hypothetical protein PAPYR_6480 [Paratrimastix pyriformis]